MHDAMTTEDALVAQLSGVLMQLFKGGNHGAMLAVAEYELTLSQLRAMFVLDHADRDLAVNEIADLVGLSMAAMGRAIDALHKAGLVSRQEDPVDRRIKRIAFTDEGLAAVQRISEARMAGILTFVAALEDDERDELQGAVDTLTRLAANHLPRLGCTPAASATTPIATEQPA